jgi:hypothetical protein
MYHLPKLIPANMTSVRERIAREFDGDSEEHPK